MNELRWSNARGVSVSETAHATTLTIDELVQQHTDFVWRLLRRLGLSNTDADDATQQVFIVAANHLSRITEDSARAFLYGTAVRVASNARRGLRRQRALQQAQQASPAGPLTFPSPDRSLTLRDACDLLDQLLSHLPDEQRRVLILVEIEQLDLERVAQLEGIPRGTASSRLRLARDRFNQLLDQSRSRNPFGPDHD